MRILVLSDVHANLAALEAVLVMAGPFSQAWCLGDVVGYGPDPDACIERLRSLDLRCLAGNHDRAAVGMLSVAEFNPDARAAALWTRSRISPPNGDWLKTLPAMSVVTELDVTLVHGSPVDPIWEYVIDPGAARAGFEAIGTRLCLNGHTHVPIVFRASDRGSVGPGERPRNGKPTPIGRGRLLINPGSVGQPRDGDPRAAFAILDTDAMTLTHHRVDYDLASTQGRMRAAGLPRSLINRLVFGR